MDDEILDTEDPNYYKNFNVLIIEIKSTLKQTKDLFKATTNFVLIDGCTVFRSDTAAQLFEIVLIDANRIYYNKNCKFRNFNLLYRVFLIGHP